MSTRRLTPEQALHEALLALSSARPGERMSTCRFWTFAPHVEGVGGGAGWNVTLTRQLGLDARTIDTAEAMAGWQRSVIKEWRQEFYPDPRPADLRQPEAT